MTAAALGNTQTTLSTVIEEAHARHKMLAPEDRYLQLKAMGQVAGADGNFFVPMDKALKVPPMRLTDHAFTQLGNLVGFPAGYVAKLPAPIRQDIMLHHVHGKSAERDDALLMRTVAVKDKPDFRDLRALLTDRYEQFDDVDLVTALDDGFRFMGMDASNIVVRGWDQAQNVTHLRLTWGEPHQLERGQVFRGVHVSNSEVGMRSVIVRAMLFVVRCSNGMLSTKTMGGIRHIGNADGLRQKVKDTIASALSDTDRLSAVFAESVKEKFQNPPNVLDGIIREGGLPHDFLLKCLEKLEGPTRWDVVNSMTAAAQDLDTWEDRYAAEVVAGRALEANLSGFDQPGEIARRRRRFAA